jgi:hypothetical protein
LGWSGFSPILILAIEGKFMLRAFIAALMLLGSSGSAFSLDRTQLLEEMRIVDEEIASADTTLSEYGNGAIAMFAKTRKEMLLLSKAAIRARLLAADDPERATVVISTFAPNEEIAVSAAADFVLAKKRVADAQAEADESGGVIKMLALVRVETERMAASRLFMAYVSARYGVAYPAFKDESVAGTKVSSVLAEPTADLSDADAADTVPAAPDWADPNHPEIDYTQAHFVSMNSAGGKMTGSWSVITSRAEIDDSPIVRAFAWSEGGGGESLVVQCKEGDVAVVYRPDDFLISAIGSDTFPVDVRINDEPVVRERWSELISNKGAGLFGEKGERAMRRLMKTNKMFLRLTEWRGEEHDATFVLAGTETVMQMVGDACGVNLLDLSAADMKTVQELLNAAGFYAGTPDGKWGFASRKAMRAFQVSVGLQSTGVVNLVTLSKLGFAR